MSHWKKVGFGGFALLSLSLLWTAPSRAQSTGAWEVNMPYGVTAISHEVYDLHMLIFWVCAVIGVGVFGVMFYSMFAHRKSRGVEPRQFHESVFLEILWTVVPMIILIAMAWPATLTMIRMYDSSEPDMDVLVTGYQWKWKYEYLGEGVSFFSTLTTTDEAIQGLEEKGANYLLEVDEPLVLPVGKKVRFLITAADVLHSWWVPEFAVKRDAIPGFINEAWVRVPQPGTYRGQCTELCGRDHGFMPIVVEVREEEPYRQWLDEKKREAERIRQLMSQTFSYDELMAKGLEVYERNCASCHMPGGEGVDGVFPALKGAAFLDEPMAAHLDVVVNGRVGTAMAAYGAQLNELELAAVITYERNAWGNNRGELLQPIDVDRFVNASE